jgi:hypothetical protein
VLLVKTSGVPKWRRAGGVEAGLTLAVARRAGPEQRCRRKGGGRHRGRGGSDEWRGGPVARGGGDGEGKSWRGGEKLGRQRRGSLLKGEPAGRQRRGGRVSRAMRGGGADESEAGPSTVGDSVVVRHWATAAKPQRVRATVWLRYSDGRRDALSADARE